MDRSPSPAETSIRARMHPGALDRMPMFFDASASTAFVELIANARRASATRVDIAVQPSPPPLKSRCRVSVRDDGHGIADPAVLLSFGESKWRGNVARTESAAGMGLLCVAKRGCVVFSRPRIRSAEYPPAWRVALEPEHFTGKATAAVFPDDTAPEPNGTCVTFEAGESLEALQAAASAVARYAPLPVTFNGEALKREDFLEGALRIEQWRGLTLAVLRSRRPLYNEPDLNFHGLTVNVRLPHVQSLDGDTWTVRAEVEDCPELELVLPARKEAVENSFLERLREEARIAIYRALAPADPPPRMAFEDHKRAAGAGIELPVPPAELRHWEPATADVDDWSRDAGLVPVGPDTLVVEYDADPPETQPFHRAAIRTKLAPMLFEADRRLAGYDWYDNLARVTDVTVQIDIGGITYSDRALHRRFKAARNGDNGDGFHFAPRDRADRIAMTVHIARPDGTRDSTGYLADVVFLDTGYGWLTDASPMIAADSDLDAGQLADLLRRAYFCPSDDADADSYATQSDQFNDAALHMALKHVASADEAARTAIRQALWREIHWLFPKNRTVDIAVNGDRIDVTLGPAGGICPADGTSPAGAAPTAETGTTA